MSSGSIHPGTPARVLVTFASRHGATREIAAAVARGLSGSAAAREGGWSAVLAPVERRPDPTGFRAVVLGSSLYGGRWLEPAVQYARDVAAELPTGATWLFSSGLPDQGPTDDEIDPRRVVDLTGARGHAWFAGRLEPRLLSAAERATWPAGGPPVGDFRDRAAISAWSREVAAGITGAPDLSAVR